MTCFSILSIFSLLQAFSCIFVTKIYDKSKFHQPENVFLNVHEHLIFFYITTTIAKLNAVIISLLSCKFNISRFYTIRINSPKLGSYNFYFFKILNKGHRRCNNVIITMANRDIVSSANNLMLICHQQYH